MKTLRLVGMALFAVLMCANFASCSSDDVAPNEPQNPKEYIVSLGFTGEISVSESPLSRASGNDLYGIHVMSCPTTSETNSYTSYAYGLFDDLTKMNIKLIEGYKYKFIATMVVDGKNDIWLHPNGLYQDPFKMELKNVFEFSTTRSGEGLGKGESDTGGSTTYQRPNTDRYYGECSEYIPVENGEVTIDMKRTSFGLKVIAENLTEGTLNIKIDYAPEMNITNPETEIEDIFTFYYVKNAYAIEDYSETANVNLTWTKSDGATIPLGEHAITFKRNKKTIITVKISDISKENNINITLENEEMTDGENITIENGEIVDTNIGTETEG